MFVAVECIYVCVCVYVCMCTCMCLSDRGSFFQIPLSIHMSLCSGIVGMQLPYDICFNFVEVTVLQISQVFNYSCMVF